MAGSSLMLAPDAYSGRKLGKYEILCRLSMGGMSEIFLAFQKGLAGFRKFVVLKQILPDIKGEEEFVRMFLDEARITAAFNHPNIAQTFDLDIADGELFLAMEFVPGATLVEVARACRQAPEPIPVGFTLSAVRDTALALHYAHSFTDPMGRAVQVIHRDIAEKNIMVTYDGTTKLLDFGIAKAQNRSSRTSVGMVKGTSGYMSPEQILGEQLDPRSDIFALGVVLHECLTGMRLFHGKNPEDAMMQALKADVAPPSRQNPQLSGELDQVVLKALRRARDDRYGTALEFARAIERVAAPLIWHPEQNAQLIARLFAERRDQTRALMSGAQSEEHTGEFKLQSFLAAEPPMPAPVYLPPPAPEAPPALPPSPARRARPPARDAGADEDGPVMVTEHVTLPRRGLEAPRTPPRPVQTPREVTQVEPLQARTDLPRKKARPGRNEPVTLPLTRASGARQPLPPPVPDDDPGHEGHFPEELTLPGQSLSELMRDDPERTSSGVVVTAGLLDEQSVVENTAPNRPGARGPWGALALVAAAVFLAVVGMGLALGLHEDLRGLVGMDDAVAEALPGPPAPVPLRPPADDFGAAEPSTDDALPLAEEPPVAGEPIVALPPAPLAELPPAIPILAKVDAAPLAEPAPEPVAIAAVDPPAPRAKAAPVTPPAPAAAPPPARAAAKRSAPAAVTAGAPGKAAEPADSWAPPAQPQKATGTLTLITEPWSTVFMGGKELGITPLVKQKLPAGRHTLKLVGPDKKAAELPVEIVADQETKVRVPLSVLKAL